MINFISGFVRSSVEQNLARFAEKKAHASTYLIFTIGLSALAFYQLWQIRSQRRSDSIPNLREIKIGEKTNQKGIRGEYRVNYPGRGSLEIAVERVNLLSRKVTLCILDQKTKFPGQVLEISQDELEEWGPEEIW